MSSVGAFVAGFGAAAFDRLFDVVSGDHAVGDRGTGFHTQLGKALGDFVVDVSGMGGATMI